MDRNLLQDLCIPQSQAILLFCYNKFALHIATNLVFHEHTMHIEIASHLVREQLQACLICTLQVPSTHQNVDLLTKPMGYVSFSAILGKMGLINIYSLS